MLDASAALAFLRREPGFEVVEAALRGGARMSAVNLAEVHTASVSQAVSPEGVMVRLRSLGLEIEPFYERDAALVGSLRPATRPLGLSLADLACLALGLRLGGAVLTADRALARADVGVEVRAIR